MSYGTNKIVSMMTEKPWWTIAGGLIGTPIEFKLNAMHWAAHALTLKLLRAASILDLAFIIACLPIDVFLQIRHKKDRVGIVTATLWLFALLPLAIFATTCVFGVFPTEGTAR